MKIVSLEGQALKNFKKNLEHSLFGNTESGHCVSCKEVFSDKNVFTDLGWKETKISKLCEKCWDKLFKE